MEHDLPLTAEQARALTDQIVSTPHGRWARIAEAHARGAADALGYPSWAAYCDGELGPGRFRIPPYQRHRVLLELKDAGMSFEDVRVAVLPRAADGSRMDEEAADPGAFPLAPAALPPGTDGRARRGPSPEDDLGFSTDELELISALIEVDDDEFRRVLTAGHRLGNLTPDFVRSQCAVVVRGRDGLERNLDRALRSIERALEMVGRSTTSPDATPGAIDLLKLVEDQAWDLVDTIDRLKLHLDVHSPRPR